MTAAANDSLYVVPDNVSPTGQAALLNHESSDTPREHHPVSVVKSFSKLFGAVPGRAFVDILLILGKLLAQTVLIDRYDALALCVESSHTKLAIK